MQFFPFNNSSLNLIHAACLRLAKYGKSSTLAIGVYNLRVDKKFLKWNLENAKTQI